MAYVYPPKAGVELPLQIMITENPWRRVESYAKRNGQFFVHEIVNESRSMKSPVNKYKDLQPCGTFANAIHAGVSTNALPPPKSEGPTKADFILKT